jgi:hypothetical protein
MFFVLLGIGLQFDNIAQIGMQAAVFSLFVLIGNPLIVIILMGAFGYNKKTSFLSGLTVAQISEFSLIMMLLAFESGFVSQTELSLVTIVGLFTIAGSTYLILYAERIYPYLANVLSLFEAHDPIKPISEEQTFDVVLFGCNRVGYDFLQLFQKLGEKLLIIDFDPDVVKTLQDQGFNAIFGDAEDVELLNDLNLFSTGMFVSTIPDHETNEFLVSHLKMMAPNSIVITISYDIDHALKLYSGGATYVILPHFIGGHFAAMLAAKHWLNIDKFHKEREKHISYLKSRIDLGHVHPKHKRFVD